MLTYYGPYVTHQKIPKKKTFPRIALLILFCTSTNQETQSRSIIQLEFLVFHYLISPDPVVTVINAEVQKIFVINLKIMEQNDWLELHPFSQDQCYRFSESKLFCTYQNEPDELRKQLSCHISNSIISIRYFCKMMSIL